MVVMPGEIKLNRQVRLWPRDRSGEPIEQDLVDAGERNWTRVYAYAQRHQQDSAQTANLLEAILVAISRARKTNGRLMRPIRNLDNYIYWAFVRRLNRQLAREPKIETVGSLQDLEAHPGIRAKAVSPSIEEELLVKEVMTFLGERPEEMFSLRKTGYSWRDVAGTLKTTVNSVQALFSQALRRAKNRIMNPKGARKTPRKGGKTHE